MSYRSGSRASSRDACAELAGAAPTAERARRAGASRSCRPWARCTPATSRSCTRRAARADRVVVSIFVNPTQFGAARGPRALPARPRRATSRGCAGAASTCVFPPSVGEIYPTATRPGSRSSGSRSRLCGAAGRATSAAWRPWSRELLHRRAAARRGLRREGLPAARGDPPHGARPGSTSRSWASPTVREPDGLRLSSRNVHLAGEARRQASALVRALDARPSARSRAGERGAAPCSRPCASAIAKAPLARDRLRRAARRRHARAGARAARRPALLALAVVPSGGHAPDRQHAARAHRARRTAHDPHAAQVQDPPRHRDRGRTSSTRAASLSTRPAGRRRPAAERARADLRLTNGSGSPPTPSTASRAGRDLHQRRRRAPGEARRHRDHRELRAARRRRVPRLAGAPRLRGPCQSSAGLARPIPLPSRA